MTEVRAFSFVNVIENNSCKHDISISGMGEWVGEKKCAVITPVYAHKLQFVIKKKEL